MITGSQSSWTIIDSGDKESSQRCLIVKGVGKSSFSISIWIQLLWGDSLLTLSSWSPLPSRTRSLVRRPTISTDIHCRNRLKSSLSNDTTINPFFRCGWASFLSLVNLELPWIVPLKENQGQLIIHIRTKPFFSQQTLRNLTSLSLACRRKNANANAQIRSGKCSEEIYRKKRSGIRIHIYSRIPPSPRLRLNHSTTIKPGRSDCGDLSHQQFPLLTLMVSRQAYMQPATAFLCEDIFTK